MGLAAGLRLAAREPLQRVWLRSASKIRAGGVDGKSTDGGARDGAGADAGALRAGAARAARRASPTLPDPGAAHALRRRARRAALLGRRDPAHGLGFAAHRRARCSTARPRLRAIIHAAGTVKGHVDPLCFERGIRVTSAAAANAVPVAEFTLAAILLAGKRAFRCSAATRRCAASGSGGTRCRRSGTTGRSSGSSARRGSGASCSSGCAPSTSTRLVYDPYLSAADAAALGAEPGRARRAARALRRREPARAVAPRDAPHARSAAARAAARRRGAGQHRARRARRRRRARRAELVAGRIDAVIDTTDPEILPADSPLYELAERVPDAAHRRCDGQRDAAPGAISRSTRSSASPGGEPLAHEVRAEDLARIA